MNFAPFFESNLMLLGGWGWQRCIVQPRVSHLCSLSCSQAEWLLLGDLGNARSLKFPAYPAGWGMRTRTEWERKSGIKHSLCVINKRIVLWLIWVLEKFLNFYYNRELFYEDNGIVKILSDGNIPAWKKYIQEKILCWYIWVSIIYLVQT